jgi:DNA (cytosine-5)-methyltransferase 1
MSLKENVTSEGVSASISEASTILNVSIDTIRRWEKKGLIKAERSPQGHRLFRVDDLHKLHAKSSGAPGVPHKMLKTGEVSRYVAIELFAGAGGLALGMENAGIRCGALVEFDKTAAATLKRNRPNWNVIAEDVGRVYFTGHVVDIVTGGFPCQAFSYAGKRLGFEDVRGTLFYEYARVIRETSPSVIIGENVRGLERHDNGRTLATMLQILDQCGYDVDYKILRAQYLDVPQKRERLVIIGTRKDLKIPIAFPKENNYTISVRAAISDCPQAPGQKYTAHKEQIMSLVPEGGYWRDLSIELQRSYMGASFFHGGGKTGMARRLAWDEPSLTLTCNPAQKQTERCHPSETRPLNVREYARIQCFPDEWEFEGSTAAQYKQIGNAVPVNLGYHIGRCAVAMLSGKYDEATMDIRLPKLI